MRTVAVGAELMPKSTVAITITIDWIDAEPDGSECFACGDTCFLTMNRLVTKVGSSDIGTATSVVLCGSCSDALVSDLGEC